MKQFTHLAIDTAITGVLSAVARVLSAVAGARSTPSGEAHHHFPAITGGTQ